MTSFSEFNLSTIRSPSHILCCARRGMFGSNMYFKILDAVIQTATKNQEEKKKIRARVGGMIDEGWKDMFRPLFQDSNKNSKKSSNANKNRSDSLYFYDSFKRSYGIDYEMVCALSSKEYDENNRDLNNNRKNEPVVYCTINENDKHTLKSSGFREIMMNGRHYNISHLVFSNTFLEQSNLEPAILCQFDYLFLAWDPVRSVRKHVYDRFFGFIDTFEEFDEIYRSITALGDFMVLDLTVPYTNQPLSEVIFHSNPRSFTKEEENPSAAPESPFCLEPVFLGQDPESENENETTENERSIVVANNETSHLSIFTALKNYLSRLQQSAHSFILSFLL